LTKASNLKFADQHPILFGQIDSGIAEVVAKLNDNGFQTIGSCEGGDGHTFHLPTIQVQASGDLDLARKTLCRFLLSRGVSGFTVKTISMHQKSEHPEDFSYIEIEFWSQDTLRYLTC